MTWTYPTSTPYVTSPYNLARMHPVYGTLMPHTGADFRAATGTPLRAASAGTVIRSVPLDPRAGNYIRIDHGDGIWTGYSHLSRRDVGVGQKVATGQVIGLAGATGAVTGAHLHFEVSVNGALVDPVPFLAARTSTASGGSTAPTTTPEPAAPEDDMRKDLDLVRRKDQAEVYIGDGLTRRHVRTADELKDLQYRLTLAGGNPEVQVVDRIDWAGQVPTVIDTAALAKAIAAAMPAGSALTAAQVQAATEAGVRAVLRAV